MLCPVCQVDLNITDRQGIEIDYCPKCRGIWLDRGELDKIIERTNAISDTYSEPITAPDGRKRKNDYPDGELPYDDTSYGDYQEHRYDRERDQPRQRRKSFLDDIFDIFD